MAIYDKITNRSITKTVGRVVTLSVDGASYGDVYLYDLGAPTETVTVQGKITGLTEWNSFKDTMLTPGATVSLNDNAGNTVSGIPTALSWDDELLAPEIKTFRLQLLTS